MIATIILAAKAAWSAVSGVWARVWGWAAKPPGLYAVAVLGAALAVWWYGGHEYRAGQTACEAAHKAAALAATLKQERHNAAVVAASEARTAADVQIVYRNKEIVRYVTRQAATLPDGGDVCVPADLADRVRGLN